MQEDYTRPVRKGFCGNCRGDDDRQPVLGIGCLVVCALLLGYNKEAVPVNQIIGLVPAVSKVTYPEGSLIILGFVFLRGVRFKQGSCPFRILLNAVECVCQHLADNVHSIGDGFVLNVGRRFARTRIGSGTVCIVRLGLGADYCRAAARSAQCRCGNSQLGKDHDQCEHCGKQLKTALIHA